MNVCCTVMTIHHCLKERQRKASYFAFNFRGKNHPRRLFNRLNTSTKIQVSACLEAKERSKNQLGFRIGIPLPGGSPFSPISRNPIRSPVSLIREIPDPGGLIKQAPVSPRKSNCKKEQCLRGVLPRENSIVYGRGHWNGARCKHSSEAESQFLRSSVLGEDV